MRRTAGLTAGLLLGMVAGVALALAAAGPAVAHSELVSSTPADGAALGEEPVSATLTFNEDIAGEFTSVALTIGVAAPVPASSTTAGPVVTVDLAMAAANVPRDVSESATTVAWKVAYRVVSADGHPIEGAIAFTAPGLVATGPSATAPPSASPTPSLTAAPSSAAPSDGAADAAPEASTGLSTVWLVGVGALAATGLAVAVALRRRSSR